MPKREFVAEVTSEILALEARMPPCQDLVNHKKYVEVWISAMSADSNFIFEAATQARRTADFVLSFSRGLRSDRDFHDRDTQQIEIATCLES